MIKGAKYWDNRDHYYRQDNNPLETFLKATMNDRSGWLESCGPTSALNCLSAMGKNVEIICPGSYKPQPEETLLDYFNDPRNAVALNSVRAVSENIPKNRVPQFYPLAVYEVFGALSQFRWGLSFDQVGTKVAAGSPVQMCLRSPGHYISVVAYDGDKQLLIYNDSWPGRFKDKNGFNRSMNYKEFSSNVQNYFIVYCV